MTLEGNLWELCMSLPMMASVSEGSGMRASGWYFPPTMVALGPSSHRAVTADRIARGCGAGPRMSGERLLPLMANSRKLERLQSPAEPQVRSKSLLNH